MMRIKLFCTIAALLVLPTVVRGATVSMSSFGTYQPGSTVGVVLGVSGLTGSANDSLSGFDFDILYDQNQLSFAGVSFEDPACGNQLDLLEVDKFEFFGDAFAGYGVLDVYGISGNSPDILDADQLNDFVFAVLTFNVLQSDDTSVSLDLSDDWLSFLDSNASELRVTYGATSVSFQAAVGGVQPVPETSSWILLATGILLGAFALKRGTPSINGGK